MQDTLLSVHTETITQDLSNTLSMSYDRCLCEILFAINCLGRHQSSIAPLPVQATAGPVFIKQNKYQILIKLKVLYKGTNIYNNYIKYIPSPSTISPSMGSTSTSRRLTMNSKN